MFEAPFLIFYMTIISDCLIDSICFFREFLYLTLGKKTKKDTREDGGRMSFVPQEKICFFVSFSLRPFPISPSSMPLISDLILSLLPL
jgi:hypothetical protein